MNSLEQIRALPTVRHFNGSAVHESVFRSSAILAKVKEYLQAGAPACVVLEIIELLETDESSKSPSISLYYKDAYGTALAWPCKEEE